MKNLLVFALIALVFINCKQKQKPVKIENQKTQIIIGQKDSIYSEILDESRELWIHIPESTKDSSLYKTKYPVLYLLDGPSNFNSITAIIEHLSDNMIVPEMIIIGIANTNRYLDLTPTRVDIDFISGDSIQQASGGGNKFLDFIEKELIPHVEKEYPASTYKTFVGHSLGGLSVINALTNRQELFNNYVAIDPSMWWDNRAFSNVADSILSANKFDNRTLYVGVANTMEAGMDINKVQNDSVADTYFTVHIKSVLQFVNSLDTKKNNELLFKWKYYENDDHGSVPFIAEYDALRFLFSWYKLNEVNDFYSENSTLNPQEILNLINSHYVNISDQFGYEVIPPESYINSIGTGFMYNDMPEKAYALLNFNVKNYPKSAKVFESMGDYYLFQSDTLNAIKEFKNGLEIGENNTLKEKLKKLGNEKL
ncbi:alpha/beta hydrolase [Maribacter litoralis]|uniref:alpha/beta hydrolase n=1 Tax=Maribacter litoralis TaxID=2059726 RepID=UPI003F5CC66C|tara:strand:- start:1229 stop:2503 length:1275 start_codon:yes stop_codon:yes gene_type:complete